MRRAPWRRAYSMVGKVSRMRVSSMTRPSSSGTLKSTRMKTRRSLSGRSRMDSLGMGHLSLVVSVSRWRVSRLVLSLERRSSFGVRGSPHSTQGRPLREH